MKAFIIFLLSILFVNDVDVKDEQSIKWLSFKEAYELNKENPKKIFIDVYTDWCGWCKKMDKNTFSDKKVVEFANENFYAIKLNAEDTDPIIINGDTATARSIARSMGVRGYPTIVYMKEDFKTIQPVSGYKNADQFLKTLQQVLEWE